jgi:hypothetical protein
VGEIYRQTSAHPFRSDKAKVDAAKARVMVIIAAGDDSNAGAAVEKLVVDFNSHPYLSAAVSQIAKLYCDKGDQLEKGGSADAARNSFQKAAGIYEIVTNRLGDSIAHSQKTGRIREYETGTPKAYFALAGCERRPGVLGQSVSGYEQSTQCYKILMDKYPEGLIKKLWVSRCKSPRPKGKNMNNFVLYLKSYI